MGLLIASMADEPTERPTAAEFRERLAALNLADDSAVDNGEDAAGAGAVGAVHGDPGAEDTRQRRRRPFVAIAVVTALVTLAVIVIASILSPNDGVAGQPPVSSTAVPVPSTSSSPSPRPPATPVPNMEVPAGFSDCSKQLGENTYCAAKAECWGSARELSGLALHCPGGRVQQGALVSDLCLRTTDQSCPAAIRTG